ncbi:MAG: disulfide bond formation protein B [Burkholderiaceae bacterium]|jgi:disulfide bond formation protein DsbB|nr:disulfide bond formation protein B [Burkholderiaceae bacterium]
MRPMAWTLLLLAWLASFAGTLGSLFFSEVMQLQPCLLCWYQRIAMFPLVLVLGIGLYRQDSGSVLYGLALAAVGWAVAGYHLLLYSGWIPENLQPCSKGLSCADVDLRLVGFLTIPLMSLLAFSMIVGLLMAAHRQGVRA